MNGKRRLGLFPVALIMMLLVVLSAPPAAALPVLDQSFDNPDGLAAAINEGCKYVVQTFTAGVTGTLSGVNVNVISRRDASPLRIAIRDATSGRPKGSPIGIRNLAEPQARLSRLIAFGEEIPVVAGHQYAIQVSYLGAEPGFGAGQGSWAGGTGNQYLGGRILFGECPFRGGAPFWHVEDLSFDLHFRTYVEPAP
jgi:hypothetical protein